jgi:hypothetical protein
MLPPPPPSRDFDQVVKGDINIKQLSKKKYKITFSKIGKFLIYQTWSDSSKPLNDDRSVYYQKAKLWINNFNYLNESLKASNKPLFTPTTVMEIGNNKYIFVLNKAKLTRKGHVVFKVSTKEIRSSDKKLLKLPHGHHDGVRFDIDEWVWVVPDTRPDPTPTGLTWQVLPSTAVNEQVNPYLTYTINERPVGSLMFSRDSYAYLNPNKKNSDYDYMADIKAITNMTFVYDKYPSPSTGSLTVGVAFDSVGADGSLIFTLVTNREQDLLTAVMTYQITQVSKSAYRFITFGSLTFEF